MNDSCDPERRFTDLEERVSYQQRAVDALNDVVLQQQAEIERLSREAAHCRNAIDHIVQSGYGEDLPREKPPHF